MIRHIPSSPKGGFPSPRLKLRGLAENGAQYDTLFALANLVIAKKA
jgi:hypothetical protein